MKSTNLEITRFIAALLVIFSHSFPIVQGSSDNEWLYRITDGQIGFGGLAVALFFLCGGYLTMKSMEHFKGIGNYIIKRFLRIVSGLMFVVIICVLAGSLISTLSFKEYFTNIITYRYLLNGIMILSHNLPGVFTDAVYMPVVNGALWTLPVEFSCNVLCCIAYKMNLLNKKTFIFTVPFVVIIGGILYIYGKNIPLLTDALRPCLVFYMGMLYYVYSSKIPKNYMLLAVSAVLLIASSIAGLLYFGVVLFLPYIFIFFWFDAKQHFAKISGLGKYSYAIYLWGFPIQQFIAMIFGWKMSPYLNTLLSSVITILFAIITYNLVEKRVRFDKKIRG